MNRLFDAVIRASIRHRHIVLLAAGMAIAYVGWLVRNARIDALPSFTPPMVNVQAEAPGLSSSEVEQRITDPLEHALLGTPELVHARSTSSPGLAVVELMFADDTDIFRARQLVSERLRAMERNWPQELPQPELAPISATVGALLRLCYSPAADDVAAMRELTRFAEQRLRPRLQAIPGVSRVSVHGGAPLRVEVRPDPAAMIARGVVPAELTQALQQAQRPLPLGFTEQGEERQPLRIDAFWTSDALGPIGATAIATSSRSPVRVADVAEVAIDEADAVGAAIYDGRRALYVQVDKVPWADTLATTAAVETTLRELDATLPAGARRQPAVFRQADFVRTSIATVVRAMSLGVVLVVIVLASFLRSGRLVAISLTAIPLSMIAALGVLLARGVTLNGMILGGLAIAVGEVVDDAIVDVENVWRRLRENAATAAPRPALEVIHDASTEIRGAVVYATSIVVVVLLPIVLLGGLAGRIFSPLAEAYALAMAASLAVALTLTPALCALLLPRLDLARAAEPALTRAARRHYEHVLAAIRRYPRPITLASLALGALALLAIPWLGGGFLPEFREGVLIAEIGAWPGTSLRETTRLSQRLALQARGVAGVRHVAARIGRASLDEDAAPVHRIEMDLILAPHTGDPDELADALGQRLSRVPGVRMSIEGFLGERIDELLSGERAPVVVKLLGGDLDRLRADARALVPRLAAIEGVRAVRAEALVDVPTTDLRIDDAATAALGLRRSDVAATVASFHQGVDVAFARAPGGFTIPIAIAGDPALRRPERLADLPIFAAAGAVLPLSSAARFATGSEPAAIRHEEGRRVVNVSASVSPADLVDTAARIRQMLKRSLRLPPGSSWQLAGQAAERSEASLRLALTVLAVLTGVFAFLAMAFGSFVDATAVLAGLPLGLVGGVAAALLLRDGLSVAGFVGFVTLLGIISRNGILLVAHKNHLLAAGPATSEEDAAVQGARERLVPILMTAGSAFFGLLPLALSIDVGGSELEAPMALIVCGGVFTSTALNLVAVPAFFIWRSRSARHRGAIAA